VSLSFMGWLTAGSLVGISIGFWLLMMMIGVTVVAIAIIAVASLVMAGLVFTGVRWTPALGALFGAGVWIGGLSSQQYSLYHLTHPQEGGPFIVSVLIYVLAIVAIVAGSVATMQNYRRGARLASRRISAFLGVLAWSGVGAPVVKDRQVNGGSITIGPFNTAGTFSMYCTVHPGMTLKVIVQ